MQSNFHTDTGKVTADRYDTLAGRLSKSHLAWRDREIVDNKSCRGGNDDQDGGHSSSFTEDHNQD